MRNLLIFAAVAALLFASCSGRNSRRHNIIGEVTDLTVDSCRYDETGNILYFSNGSIAVKRFKGDDKVIIAIDGSDTIKKDGTITLKRVIEILDEKCTPEPYSLICLRQFKQVIQKESLDSSFVNTLESGDYYDFYLRSYKVSINVRGYVPFESKGEIYITTVNIVGESVADFCSNKQEWSYEQKKEILQLLLAKKSTTYKSSEKSTTKTSDIQDEKYWQDARKEIISGVMDEFNK